MDYEDKYQAEQDALIHIDFEKKNLLGGNYNPTRKYADIVGFAHEDREDDNY